VPEEREVNVNTPPRLSAQFVPLTLGLSLLFAALSPPTTQSLPFWQAWGHWWVHVAVGLGLAMLAARGMSRVPAAMPLPVFVLLSGSLGALLFAPAALALESVLPHSREAGADGTLDAWDVRGGGWAVLAELLQLAPSYLASWFLVNAAPVFAGRTRDGTATAAASPPAPPAGEPVAASPAHSRVLDRLPPAVGRDLVSISADLHYLQVVTTRGRATVLGSLSQVETDLAGLGLRLHRAHWVAIAHVKRLQKSAQGWRCELRDGRRLPVSRRRVAEVRASLGRDFVMADPASGAAA
jgi:hypothetical protein